MAEVSLRCAELLNKWAAATPEYSAEIMVRSGERERGGELAQGEGEGERESEGRGSWERARAREREKEG